MNWLIARLKEPSTYAGLAAICVAIGSSFPPAAVVTVPLAAVLGALATVTKEKAS